MNTRRKWWIIAICLVSAIALIGIWGCGKKSVPDFEAEYDVIIVGGGMGGLSAGAHLASNGLKVLLLEQHHKVGGCTTNFTRGDFVFDVALHEMAGGVPGRSGGGLFKLLEICGVGEMVDIYELPEMYRSIYPGDLDITMPSEGWEEWDNTLLERWPEEAEGIEEFHTLCATLYSDILDIKDLFRYTGFKALKIKLSVPLKHKTLMTWSGDKTLQDLMDECFTDEDIKAVVSQLWLYYTGPVPEQTSLLHMAAMGVFMSDGVCHVMGTSQALSNAYAARIEELGGTVLTGNLVTEIIIEDGLAKGVVTEFGDVYTGRYVICNTDPFQMVFTLVGEEYFPADYVERIESLRVSNSICGVYMGLNIDLAAMGYHDTEIFYNKSMDSTFIYDSWMSGDIAEAGLAITLYSNYGDPIYAPPGKTSVVLMAYSDYNIWPKDQDEYQAMKEEIGREMIETAAEVIPELDDPGVIEVMEVFTPVTINEFTKNREGIIYGFYMSPDQWEKIPNNTPIDNLFITSNWTQGWHGVSAGQVNGWRAARMIMDMEGIE